MKRHLTAQNVEIKLQDKGRSLIIYIFKTPFHEGFPLQLGIRKRHLAFNF